MLATALPDLFLVDLGPTHAARYFELLQRNHDHLTARGDFVAELAAPLERWVSEFETAPAPGRRFGIFLQDTLVGRVDLIAVEPPKYSVGYWLAEDSTGRGYATAALSRALALAREDLGATDAYAGVTHGNVRSEAMLERLGFQRTARFERYTRFHRAL
jgi:RimJ/RimL family protein N-acetyltransferase